MQVEVLHAAPRLVPAELPGRRDRRQPDTVLRSNEIAHLVRVDDEADTITVGPQVQRVAAPVLDPVADPRADGDVIIES